MLKEVRSVSDALLERVRLAVETYAGRTDDSAVEVRERALIATLRVFALLIAQSKTSGSHSIADLYTRICTDGECLPDAALMQELETVVLGNGVRSTFDSLTAASLAAVYEDLLCFAPVRMSDSSSGQWRFVRKEKTKKRGGNFYTQEQLARFLVNETLTPLLEQSSADEILALKIVDPSMGAAAFLRAVSDCLLDALNKRTPAKNDRAIKREILTECIYGVDSDAVACEVAALVLWLDALFSGEGAQSSMSLAPLDFGLLHVARTKLRHGNSLMGAQDGDQFSWRRSFPEVFEIGKAGFDAVLGNPPWEIEKPNSREFFGRFDPLFWTYGKQDALRRQQELVAADPRLGGEWEEYQRSFDELRKRIRSGSRTADNCDLSPFRFQGSADLNAYKLFLELSYRLLNENGCLGLVLPAGIYNDLGCSDLRRLLLDNCNWKSLIGFENRSAMFDIHRSFKFCVLTAQKGSATDSIRTSFMRQSVPESAEANLKYDRGMLERFSPTHRCFLEIDEKRDAEVLSKIFSNSCLLGDGSWQLSFRREFDMTNDSALFESRDRLEDEGYRADQYGHWLKGRWKRASDGERSLLAEGKIISSDREHSIAVDDIQDVALPLYEGRMVGQFDFAEKGWLSGKGRTAVWKSIPHTEKQILPQYLMRASIYRDSEDETCVLKTGFLAVGSATNARSMIAASLDRLPCGNSVGTFRVPSLEHSLALSAVLNSFVFDYVLRCRMAGNNLNYFILEECPLPPVETVLARHEIIRLTAELNLNHPRFARIWLELQDKQIVPDFPATQWAQSTAARLQKRVVLDALIAHLYGLNGQDLQWILRGCDRSPDQGTANAHPKGFWRIDKDKAPQERHTWLTLAALSHLEAVGVEQFISENQRECRQSHTGCQIPGAEELRIHAANLRLLWS